MAAYAYVVDVGLNDARYQAELTRIENRLANLGLSGRWEKMTILKNIQDATLSAIKRGATTVVVVGNDLTITKILPIVIEHKVTLGLIPLGPDQQIAEALGIPVGLAACDVLSRRIIARVDLGKANGYYFLLQLSAGAPASITCDNCYTVSSLDPHGQLEITNLRSDLGVGRPNDGRMELVVRSTPNRGFFGRSRPTYSDASVFPIKQAKIQSVGTPANLVLDGQTIVKAPITVQVAPGKLTVIVGPGRHF